VEGKSLAAIAREEGVSRQIIAKQAKSDDVRQILVTMVNAQLDRLDELFRRTLEVIAEAYDARVGRAGKDRAPVNLGPDHYARLAAEGAVIKLMTGGRPVPEASASASFRTSSGTMYPPGPMSDNGTGLCFCDQ